MKPVICGSLQVSRRDPNAIAFRRIDLIQGEGEPHEWDGVLLVPYPRGQTIEKLASRIDEFVQAHGWPDFKSLPMLKNLFNNY